MSIRGWVFSLLVSNQSSGGVVSFVAVCLPALLMFLKNSVYSKGVLLSVAVSSFSFFAFCCMLCLLFHRPGSFPNLFWL
jgi:hypothetical protein